MTSNAWFPFIEGNQGFLGLLALAFAVWVWRHEFRRAEAASRARVLEPARNGLLLVKMLLLYVREADADGADFERFQRHAVLIAEILENVAAQPIPDTGALHGVADAVVTARRLAALNPGGGAETRRNIRAETGRLTAIEETLTNVLTTR
jgi:hypothetical protein